MRRTSLSLVITFNWRNSMLNNKPMDATHRELDGTFWKNEKGTWAFWRDGWGWCQYVGIVNSNFLKKFMEL